MPSRRWSSSSFGDLERLARWHPDVPRVPYAFLDPYALTWIGVGVSLLRGRPVVDQPSAIGAPSG
jgi:hypothetical protein